MKMQSDTSRKISDDSSETIKEKSPAKKKSGKLLWFFCGILWGIVFSFIAGVLFLRHFLIQEIPVQGDFSEIVGKIPPAAEQMGWMVSYNQCGLPRQINGDPIEVYRFCKQDYASELLLNEDDRKISCILPCAVAIYRKSDGITYISRLNMPLVTQLLGGSPVKIFSERIIPEQQVIFFGVPPADN